MSIEGMTFGDFGQIYGTTFQKFQDAIDKDQVRAYILDMLFRPRGGFETAKDQIVGELKNGGEF